MTPLDAALAYATRAGWPVFPWRPDGKAPITKHGFKDASLDPKIITAWWSRSPRALIGAPTGAASGFVLLDVDIKHAPISGFDTLDELGFAVLPLTPIAHTPSGGMHFYFAAPADFEVRNTDGTKSRWQVGAGLDWRGWGGGAKLPTPGSAYSWDPICNLDTVPLAPVPRELLPRERAPERRAVPKPARPCKGLSPYADAAINSACRRVETAPDGSQRQTLNDEALSLGTLAGAGACPPEYARAALKAAGSRMTSYRRPRWTERDIVQIVDRAFDDGLRKPRGAPYAR